MLVGLTGEIAIMNKCKIQLPLGQSLIWRGPAFVVSFGLLEPCSSRPCLRPGLLNVRDGCCRSSIHPVAHRG